MGNNVNFVNWKWDHFVIGSGRLGCSAAVFYVYKNTTQNASWIRDGNKILYFEN